MRRVLYIAGIIIACYLLQTTVFSYLRLGQVAPNLLIIVTSSFAFMRGEREGLFVGFFCGLILDLFSGTVLGFYALVYMFTGFLVGYCGRMFFPENTRMPLIMIAASDFLLSVVVYIALFALRGRTHFLYYLGSIIVPELVYTMIIALFMYFGLYKLNHFLEKAERREI